MEKPARGLSPYEPPTYAAPAHSENNRQHGATSVPLRAVDKVLLGFSVVACTALGVTVSQLSRGYVGSATGEVLGALFGLLPGVTFIVVYESIRRSAGRPSR